ncbi:hypothetical protein JCM11641_004178 [Rhodosporidiobolus odoratus]
MSASLARTVFKPTPTTSTRSAVSACPAQRLLSLSPRPSSVSARTANAIAHFTVGAALAVSAVSLATQPDSLLFDHPPRSAISWVPARHLAVRELHTASPTSASTPSFRPSPPPERTLSSPVSRTTATTATVGSESVSNETRLAGIIGRRHA